MGRKHGVLTPKQRSAALLTIEGLTGQEVATKLGSNRVWVTATLNKPHVIKFRERQEEKLCDKIADNLAIDMSESLGFLNEHLLEHVKSIHDIGMGDGEGLNPATQLRANESFCKLAGMSFKEKENKTEKLPDIKIDMDGYENEQKDVG